MEMLDSLNKQQPSSAQMLFSTHPMSHERLAAAVQRDQGPYARTRNAPVHRERYMDQTAALRQRKKVIELMQQGEKYLGQEKYDAARTAFLSALKQADDDYAGHVLMAKCSWFRKKIRKLLPMPQQPFNSIPQNPRDIMWPAWPM